jgi:hypothetical protein
VVLGLEEIDCFIGDAVYEAVLLGDSPGPAAAAYVFHRFRFSEAFEPVPHDRIDQIKDSHRNSALVFDPKSEVLKKLELKYGNPFSLSFHRESLSVKRMEFQV